MRILIAVVMTVAGTGAVVHWVRTDEVRKSFTPLDVPSPYVSHPWGRHTYRTVPFHYGYGVGWEEEVSGTGLNGGCIPFWPVETAPGEYRFEFPPHGLMKATVCLEHRVWRSSVRESREAADNERWQRLPEHFATEPR